MYTELTSTVTDQDRALQRRAHEFAEQVLRPASIALDALQPADVIAEGSVLWDVFRQAYGEGWHVRNFPETLAGMGLGPLVSHMVNEELGWGSADFAVALSVCSFPFAFAASRNDPEILRDIVRPFVLDREARYIGCWAITEPDHGSDTLMPGTGTFTNPQIQYGARAMLVGDEYVVDGQKSAWVSNGTIATHALVFLGVDRVRGMAGGGVALVPLNLPGVSKGRPLDKLGQRALNQGEIFFDNVRIPRSYMLVEPDAYPLAIDAALAGANAFMGAVFTGVARAAFEEALAYAKSRVQGAAPICEHQLVQKKLFDMFIKVESARQLSRAAMIHNSSAETPDTRYSIASKVYATQSAFEVASEAVQLHGGYGLVKGVLVEKLLRDARASLIEDGSNDILALTAAHKILERYTP